MYKLALLLFALVSVTAHARDTYVKGYTRANGTYVQPHYRSAPNGTTYDNYSTRGNVNPYTGSYGTKPATPPSFDSYNRRPRWGQ
jgi:hypothetical protein